MSPSEICRVWSSQNPASTIPVYFSSLPLLHHHGCSTTLGAPWVMLWGCWFQLDRPERWPAPSNLVQMEPWSIAAAYPGLRQAWQAEGLREAMQ